MTGPERSPSLDEMKPIGKSTHTAFRPRGKERLLRESTGSVTGTTRRQETGFGCDAQQSNPSVIPSYVPSLAQNILSYLILLGGVLTIPAAAYLTIASYTGIPFWDEWAALHSLATTPHPLPLGWFFWQHNEHRILIYRLLLLADFHFFHGRQVLLYVSMFVMQLGFLVTMAWLLRRVGELRGALWRTTVGLAAFCLFCPSQWENFCWAFQVSFFVPGFFALLAFLSVVLYQRPGGTPGRRWSYVILGLTVASIATYSNGNGMLIWPLLLGIAVMLRVPFKMIGVYALFGFCVSASYFFRYNSPTNHSQPLESLSHMSTVVEYVAKYFGGSFAWITRSYFVPIGWGALLAAMALIAWTIARGHIRRPLPLILVGLILFCLMSAFITALGRINFGTDQAFASRYQTLAMLFWFCLACLLLLALVSAEGRASTSSLMAGIVVIMIIAAATFRFPLREARARRAWQNAASMALMTRVPDYGTIAHTYQLSQIPWQDSLYLRDQHLSFFSTGLYRQLDEPLASAYHISPQNPCQGHVDSVELVPDERTDSVGLKICGWTVDAKSRRPLRQIIVAVDGKIAGFGGVGFERRDVVAALHSGRALLSGWIGFAQVPVSARVLEVYGQVNGGGGICESARVPVPTHGRRF